MIRTVLAFVIFLTSGVLGPLPAAADGGPLRVGIDGEYGLKSSTSAQAIERGVRIAVAEINAAGGVLGGRTIEVVTRDNRSLPARGIDNLQEFIADPAVIAVFAGRFSPVVFDEAPIAEAQHMPLLAVWSSAEGITRTPPDGSYVFRLSLRDLNAMPAMIRHAVRLGWGRVGLLLPNTAWGRSNLKVAEDRIGEIRGASQVGVSWYNWGNRTMVDRYEELVKAGAQAIIFVANDIEGEILVREMAALPPERRLPLICHWGITGGEFVRVTAGALSKFDLSVIQTFSFFSAEPGRLARFMAAARPFGITRIEDIESPVGTAHGYDMMHVLARAVTLAGSADRAAIRDALERVRDYPGLIRDYPAPFSESSHEALTEAEVFMARFRDDGVIVPIR
ncbi:MAG: ABC transporter substrate-binding protein [Rhodospirillaceae bacterium]